VNKVLEGECAQKIGHEISSNIELMSSDSNGSLGPLNTTNINEAPAEAMSPGCCVPWLLGHLCSLSVATESHLSCGCAAIV